MLVTESNINARIETSHFVTHIVIFYFIPEVRSTDKTPSINYKRLRGLNTGRPRGTQRCLNEAVLG